MKTVNIIINGHQVTNDDARKVLVRVQNIFKKYGNANPTKSNYLSMIECLMERHSFSYKAIDAAFDFIHNNMDFTEKEKYERAKERIWGWENGLSWAKPSEEDYKIVAEVLEDEQMEIANECCEIVGNTLEKIDAIVDAANEIIEKMRDCDDYDVAGLYAQNLYAELSKIEPLRSEMFEKINTLTGCSCVLEDFAGCDEGIYWTPYGEIDLDENFDLEYTYRDALEYGLKNMADADEIVSTLFNLIAA